MIEVQQLVDGQWVFYCCLVASADRPGHYGAAADLWVWARSTNNTFRIRSIR